MVTAKSRRAAAPVAAQRRRAAVRRLWLRTQLARHIGYSAEELAALPEGANMGLSCGNPNALASLQPGEVVLDLGSGGGFDVFIAGGRWARRAVPSAWT